MVDLAHNPKKIGQLAKNDGFLIACIKKGDLKLLKWTASKILLPWSVRACTTTIRLGRLDILKWLLEQQCPWDDKICERAAASGQLEVLKWAIEEREYPWDSCKIATAAAKKGKLNILQWMHEQGRFDQPTVFNLCRLIGLGGYIELLKWAREKDYRWTWTTTRSAALKGHLELLKWAIGNGCAPYLHLRLIATTKKQQHIVQWAIENNY